MSRADVARHAVIHRPFSAQRRILIALRPHTPVLDLPHWEEQTCVTRTAGMPTPDSVLLSVRGGNR
jgi:hypothetical protein